MGDPYFQIKEFCLRHKVAIFSSNFQLYQDLSKRVMDILSESSQTIEIYSIDEAFLAYPEGIEASEVFADCVALRKKLKDWVGLPVSLGIAPTKTLAKVASSMAKKGCGIFDLTDLLVQKDVLSTYTIGDVWGIGSNKAKLLKSMGIRTALDFREMDAPSVRIKMGVVGERMLWELRGIQCSHLEEPKAKKSITVSRSFGKIITEQEELEEALSTFASSAAEKLRTQASLASEIAVFVYDGLEIYEEKVEFSLPTNDTSEIIVTAKQALKTIFSEGKRYKKCGVVLIGLLSENQAPTDLFAKKASPKRKILMQAIDQLNGKFGKNSLFFGASGVNSSWHGKSNKHSGLSTTEWDHLPTVKLV